MSKLPYFFERLDDDNVTLGGRNLRIKLRYGIESSVFMEYVENLVDNYRLKFNLLETEVPVNVGGNRIVGRIHAIFEYAAFIIYSNLLERQGIDIRNLVTQIRPCKDFLEIRHARGLAELGYVYHKNNYDIEFFTKRGPDLSVDYIKSDLKVVQPYPMVQYKREPKVSKGSVDIPHEILRDITDTIRSRFLESLKHSDLLFFDLSDARFFSILDIISDKINRPVEPKENRLILYSITELQPGAIVYRTFGNKTDQINTRAFPENIAFNSYYLDFEPSLWSSMAGKWGL